MLLCVEQVSKSSGKSNLQVNYTGRQKNIRGWGPQYCTRGGASRGTVSFSRVHGRALVEDQAEKWLAFLRLEGKIYV